MGINNIKITLDHARQEFIDRGYIPLFNHYNNAKEKLLAKTIEGYKVLISLDKLKQGRTPPIFAKYNPYTIENIKLYLVVNNIDLKFLSGEYINNSSKFNFITSQGFKISSTYKELHNQHAIVGMYNPHSIDNIELWLKTHNIYLKVIEKEYNYLNEKIELIDDDGYRVNIWWRSLQIGDIPELFSTYNPYTIENIKLWLTNSNLGYTLISKKYENTHSKLILKCQKHGYFKISWSELYTQKHRCPLCSLENRSGNNHYNWKGGLSSDNEMFRKSLEYKNWRTEVFKRDNYTCQCCGVRGGKLNVHHKYNFADYPDLRFDMDNGVTLCENCHISKVDSFHHRYGTKNNTKEQFDEYISVVQKRKACS